MGKAPKPIVASPKGHEVLYAIDQLGTEVIEPRTTVQPYNPVLCEIFAYQNVVAIRDNYPARQALLHG